MGLRVAVQQQQRWTVTTHPGIDRAAVGRHVLFGELREHG